MSCLLPQFKCLPDTFSFQSKVHLHTNNLFPKSREPIHFRTQCMVSTASPPPSTSTTSVVDMEKLCLLSSEAHSSPAADRPWTYIGTVDPPPEVDFGASLATEALITSEEATIAAASAEAVALAKAAVKMARNAVTMVIPNSSTTFYGKSVAIPSEADNLLFDRAQLAEKSIGALTGSGYSFPFQYPLKEDDMEPTSEELELLQKQTSDNVTVRSRRQTERKAKRRRAAEKAAANIVSVESGPTSRRKRTVSQDIDFSDPLRFLRGTASSSRLLTPTEEQDFSEAIQDLLKLEKLQDELAERCGIQPTFAQWADAAGVDQKTLRKRVNHGIVCRDKMVKSNIRLVISIAKKYQGAGLNLQDLIQEGCRGLVRGVEKFDASKGFKFSTYAHWWIKQAVRRSLSDQSRTIRLPCHMVEATYRVNVARKQLYNENGRHPNNEEVAAAAGISMTRLNAVLLAPKDPISLDQKGGFNLDLKPSEVIADPDAETSEEWLMKKFMKKDLAKVLDTLNPREKQVIKWRFGFGDGRVRTLQEIGELMNVSRERIRQIESCAFRKLKNKKRTKHLQQYVVP